MRQWAEEEQRVLGQWLMRQYSRGQWGSGEAVELMLVRQRDRGQLSRPPVICLSLLHRLLQMMSLTSACVVVRDGLLEADTTFPGHLCKPWRTQWISRGKAERTQICTGHRTPLTIWKLGMDLSWPRAVPEWENGQSALGLHQQHCGSGNKVVFNI